MLSKNPRFACFVVRSGIRAFSSYNSIIDPTRMVLQSNPNPKAKVPHETLEFGKTFTDHLFEIDWSHDKGWDVPKITPYRDFEISPAAAALHYSVQCFEGMKAYKDKKGTIRMFRPDCNMERLNNSMVRLGLPPIDKKAVQKCIEEVVKVDQDWIPTEEGYSLYIRPTAIGTSPYLGLQGPQHAKLFAILCPVGPYYRDGFKPVTLFADTENVRAWPGGVGNSKLGGNYGPTIAVGAKAVEKGYSQVLWLFGKDHLVCEVGAMNIFFAIKSKDGSKVEIVTPPLTRGDILPGVTRRSILELARDSGKYDVSERGVTMPEILQASQEGRLMEAFGAGTAAIISPVKMISYMGNDIKLPTGESAGPIAQSFWNQLSDIQYGKVPHKWSVVINN